MDSQETQDTTKRNPLHIVIDEIEGSHGTYESVPVQIEEVSSGGVRFIANVNLSIDEQIAFHLPSIDVTTLLSGKIDWKKEIDVDQYVYVLRVKNE